MTVDDGETDKLNYELKSRRPVACITATWLSILRVRESFEHLRSYVSSVVASHKE